jgi:hypothetical protein
MFAVELNTRGFRTRCEYLVATSLKFAGCYGDRGNRNDQKTQIRQISAVFTQEGFENGQTKKSRHVQDEDCGDETRTRSPVLQAPLVIRVLGLTYRCC